MAGKILNTTMSEYYSVVRNDRYLKHHGIKGQKWGIRRFQNLDGSWTAAGKARRQQESDRLKDYVNKDGSYAAKRKQHYRELKTKNGETIYLDKQSPGVFGKLLKNSNLDDDLSFNIVDSSGKKVGNLFVDKIDDDELNLNWINVSRKARGKGYASAVTSEVVKYAKEKGYKKVTLEVPGSSPDARHIYEKLGFKETKVLTEDDVWDGLTRMELQLRK